MSTLGIILSVVVSFIGILGAGVGAAGWFYARGKKEGVDELRLKRASEDLEQTTMRVSSVPQVERSILDLASMMKRNHEENRERLDKQEAKVDRLVSQHSELKASIAGVEATLLRKVSWKDLKVPTGTDWSAEAAEAERKR